MEEVGGLCMVELNKLSKFWPSMVSVNVVVFFRLTESIDQFRVDICPDG